MLPSITHLVWMYVATTPTKRFFRIESSMQLDSASAGNLIFHRQDIPSEGERGWMIHAIASAMVTLPMLYLVSPIQRELRWSSSFWADAVHGADGEPQCLLLEECYGSACFFCFVFSHSWSKSNFINYRAEQALSKYQCIFCKRKE